jgi:hypothetical protein
VLSLFQVSIGSQPFTLNYSNSLSIKYKLTLPVEPVKSELWQCRLQGVQATDTFTVSVHITVTTFAWITVSATRFFL